jgi:hypothetical protein
MRRVIVGVRPRARDWSPAVDGLRRDGTLRGVGVRGIMRGN